MKRLFITAALGFCLLVSFPKKSNAILAFLVAPDCGTACLTSGITLAVVGGAAASAFTGVYYYGPVLTGIGVAGSLVGGIGLILDEESQLEEFDSMDSLESYLADNFYSDNEIKAITSDFRKIDKFDKKGTQIKLAKFKGKSMLEKIALVKTEIANQSKVNISQTTSQFILESLTTEID